MLGYNKQKQANYFHFIELSKWKKRNWISEEAFGELIEKINPRYKQTNIFLNIGLFLLTSVIVSSSVGLLSLFTFELFDFENIWFPSLLAGSLMILALQRIVIDDKDQFRTGADDATLYYALGFFFTALFVLLEAHLFQEDLFISGFFVICFAVPAYIYTDRLLSAAATISLVAFIIILFFKLGTGVALFLPFILMISSALGYLITHKNIRTSKSVAIQECLEVINWLSISLFYCAGNYLVVTELGKTLGLESSFPLVIQWFFYFFTVAIPISYIYFGLRRKELALINIGLLALAIGVYTLGHYHYTMSIELALIGGGAFLIAVAWVALKYWSTDKAGISVKPDESTSDGMIIESLVINQTFSNSGTDSSFSGEGGEFGGGGASGSF